MAIGFSLYLFFGEVVYYKHGQRKLKNLNTEDIEKNGGSSGNSVAIFIAVLVFGAIAILGYFLFNIGSWK
jgi:hypothetical protein